MDQPVAISQGNKRPIKNCRINRFTAIFLTEKKLLFPNGQIMGKDIDYAAFYTELTADNVARIKAEKFVTDFIVRKRPQPEITDFHKDPLNIPDLPLN